VKYPTREFQHYDERFAPSTPVPDDHPMVELRPDLFTDKAPKVRKPRKPTAAVKASTTTVKE
jgi:hypothetical protein